jgi:transcriptional regulator with XRE-family HTH domain
VSSAQTAFGHRLREARERRGLSIDTIAASTKINGALFAELERGDIKHWPSAIFRRAFFREYAGAIGLDPEPLLPDFLRLFPEDPSIQADTVVRPEAPRMILAPGRSWTVAAALRRAGSALAELAVVAAAGAGMAAFGAADLWTSVAITAMGYWTLSTAILGRGVVAWFVERQAHRATSRPATAHQLRIVTRQPAVTANGAGVDAEVPGLRAASR